MSFANVPLCDDCYRKRSHGQEPFRLRDPDQETCHDCGQPTKSGIYCRIEVLPPCGEYWQGLTCDLPKDHYGNHSGIEPGRDRIYWAKS